MTGFRLLALLALCVPAVAEEGRLIALRSSLVAVHAIPADSAGPRGAAPQLTVAKHQLRDWIETRLELLTRTGDEGELERKLNSELRESKLLCATDVPELQPCYLKGIQFGRSGGFLILKTGRAD